MLLMERNSRSRELAMGGVILLLRFMFLCDLSHGACVVGLLIVPVRRLQWSCSLV